jgi:acetyl-CoA carboxylase carboxyl transferase subunit beta
VLAAYAHGRDDPTAIAEPFAAVAAVRVPVTSLVIGEGGSGGALALASHQRLWIAPDAYFSVIAPEAATAILKRTPADVPDVASELRISLHELLGLGVVAGIARDEPADGRSHTPTHPDPDSLASSPGRVADKEMPNAG